MKKLEVPKLFVDETSMRILIAALYRPRTALQIRRATGVPVALVFSRLRLLRQKGLISEAGSVLGRDGREVPVYRSNLYNAYVFVDTYGKLKVRFQRVSEGPEDYTADASALV